MARLSLRGIIPLVVFAVFTAPPRVAGQATPFSLEDGTPVKLRLSRNLSSADAKVGEKADFEVLEEIKVGDRVVIPKGGLAWGTVTVAEPKKRMGRGGKLDVNIDSVRLVDGEKVALRAVKGGSGGGHVGAMTGAIVATSIVFFPAAPFFLFMHGKDITIPQGTEITAYINGNTNLDPAKFATKATEAPASSGATPANSAVPATPGTPEASSVIIKSTPEGAEILVDGKFAGNTPSTVRLAPGEHAITIQKSGFQAWSRTMVVNSGSSLTIDATLDKPPSDQGRF